MICNCGVKVLPVPVSLFHGVDQVKMIVGDVVSIPSILHSDHIHVFHKASCHLTLQEYIQLTNDGDAV